MSSSSEGRPFTAVVVIAAVVAVAAVAAVAAALLRSLLSLTATLLHGVAEPDDSPLVLFPVVGKASIGNERQRSFTGRRRWRVFAFFFLGVLL